MIPVQTGIASAMITMISTAKNAASTPSTVELVTICSMSPMFCAGASTSPSSSASWKASR
jgi:hypothetical protein